MSTEGGKVVSELGNEAEKKPSAAAGIHLREALCVLSPACLRTEGVAEDS
jgi:hypothetical protein